MLGKAYRIGRIDPNAFGGAASNTPQGALIEAVEAALSDTPLASLLREAYDRDLRNAVSHNDYELKVSDEAGSRGPRSQVGATMDR